MMRRIAATLFILVMAGTLMGGSCNSVVRDENVFRTELDFFEQTSKQPADRLAQWVSIACKCEGGKFTDKWCAETAKLVQVVRTRVPYHKAMALFNAGLLEKRPPKDPPKVPPATDLCPGG